MIDLHAPVVLQLKLITPKVPLALEERRELVQTKGASEQLRREQQGAERKVKLQAAESGCGKRQRSMSVKMQEYAQQNLKSFI